MKRSNELGLFFFFYNVQCNNYLIVLILQNEEYFKPISLQAEMLHGTLMTST